MSDSTVTFKKGDWLYEVSKPEDSYPKDIIYNYMACGGRLEERTVNDKNCVLIISDNREAQCEVIKKYTIVTFLLNGHQYTGYIDYAENAEEYIKDLEDGKFKVPFDYKHDKCMSITTDNGYHFSVNNVCCQKKTIHAVIKTGSGFYEVTFTSRNPDQTAEIMAMISDVNEGKAKFAIDNDTIIIDGDYQFKGQIKTASEQAVTNPSGTQTGIIPLSDSQPTIFRAFFPDNTGGNNTGTIILACCGCIGSIAVVGIVGIVAIFAMRK
jgi:hypothetical protein